MLFVMAAQEPSPILAAQATLRRAGVRVHLLPSGRFLLMRRGWAATVTAEGLVQIAAQFSPGPNTPAARALVA